MDTEDAIRDITRINEHIREFWGNGCPGWAPPQAAEMLSKSRLDWQVSLSHTLRKWCEQPQEDQHDACLILAWANLGALVEGTMKWFLCVFYSDYSENPVRQNNKTKEAEELALWKLTEYFSNTVWTDTQKQRWAPLADLVRQRRNAIHAYKDRDIGNFDEFRKAVMEYRKFLLDHCSQVPYPDEQYVYPADILEMHANNVLL